MTTNISWTDETWNPVVGCSLKSPGCTRCYAMKMAARLQRMNKGKTSHYDGTTKVVNGNAVWTGKLALAPEHILEAPLRWGTPRMVFVNSMGDVFHEDADLWWVQSTLATAIVAHHLKGHIFQFLTKRSDVMRRLLSSDVFWSGVNMFVSQMVAEQVDPLNRTSTDLRATVDDYDPQNPPAGLWFGVSCEDQTRADERIPDLLATPAAVRFVSAEPLLGWMNFRILPWVSDRGFVNALTGETQHAETRTRFPDLYPDTAKLDWIIAGGESGSGFRPMQIEWAESIRQQCADVGTAFFFKQDSAQTSGQRGRASDALWVCKQFPEVK